MVIRNDLLNSLADACHLGLLRFGLLGDGVDIGHAVAYVDIQVWYLVFWLFVAQKCHQVLYTLLVLLMHAVVNGQLAEIVILDRLCLVVDFYNWVYFVAFRLESLVRSHAVWHWRHLSKDCVSLNLFRRILFQIAIVVLVIHLSHLPLDLLCMFSRLSVQLWTNRLLWARSDLIRSFSSCCASDSLSF